MQSEKNKENSSRNGYTNENAYDTWSDFYKQITDEGMSFFRQGVEMAQQMSPFYMSNEIFQQWMENYSDFINQISQRSSAPLNAADYRNIYESWLDAWNKNLESYMQTQYFAEKSGKNLETMSDFKKKGGELMEAYWHNLHLPNTEDMREIYHKLYTIERKLDDMDRKLQQMYTAKTSASAKKS